MLLAELTLLAELALKPETTGLAAGVGIFAGALGREGLRYLGAKVSAAKKPPAASAAEPPQLCPVHSEVVSAIAGIKSAVETGLTAINKRVEDQTGEMRAGFAALNARLNSGG